MPKKRRKQVQVTPRSTKYLRSKGYVVEKVERWNHFAKVRQDFAGIGDLIAFNEEDVLAVQVTTTPNMKARRHKILAEPRALIWLQAKGRRILIHGWDVRAQDTNRKKWTLSVEEIELCHFTERPSGTSKPTRKKKSPSKKSPRSLARLR